MDSLENLINVCWVSDGQQIGNPMQMSVDQNGNKIVFSSCSLYDLQNSNGITWIPGAGGSASDNTGPIWVLPNTITIGDPPYTTPGYPPYAPPTTYLPSIGGGFPYPSIPLPVEEKDEKGNRIVKSPPPSLELILVEIAKVLRDRGDILGIREIFEKHKLKLVDHDGEIIFDPRKPEELEDKGF
jgi:hypothetical protein